MSRADYKHKPSRQVFKGISHQDMKAAELRNFLPNFAVPESLGREGAGGKAVPAEASRTVLASHCNSFTPCGADRPPFLGVWENFRCAHFDDLG